MRAFYAKGVDILPNAWLVEGLPTLLHLSLFLFFAGTIIFLFNINHAVFYSVSWWIGPFAIVYGLITLLPFIRYDSPYYSPLSPAVWLLYAGVSYLIYKVIFYIRSDRIVLFSSWQRLRHVRDRYRDWSLGGREKAAEETVSEQSSVIDADILRWTIDAFGDDDRMEEFFDSLPGFFKSKLVKDLKGKLPDSLRKKFWMAINGFIERTLSSNSVVDRHKYRRLEIGMDATSAIALPGISSIPKDIFFESWDQVPQNVEMGHTVARWCASRNGAIAQYAQCIATRILAGVRECNDRWIELTTGVLGLSERSLRDYIAHGNDSVSLAILISVARRHIHTGFYDWGILSTLNKLSIHNTLPELQHDFCALWNLCVEEAIRQQPDIDTFPVGILRLTRFLYMSLHEGTQAHPTSFSASTQEFDHMLFRADSYPLCHIHDHRPDSTVSDSHAEIGETSQPTLIPFLVPVIPTLGPVGGSRSGGVAVARQDLSSIATLLNPLEGNKQRDMATKWVIPDIGQISSTAPTFSVVPTSAIPVFYEPLASHDVGSTSTFSTFEFPASPSSLPSLSTTLTLPRLRSRGLINGGNMCFANTALQLLVYCPQFWNQLTYISWLVGQCGQLKGRQDGGPRTVLVDATIRFLGEFVDMEKPSLMQQSQQLAEKAKARENEREKKVDNGTDPFIPTYVYDAMKEKRPFKRMLVRTCAYVLPF